MEGLARIRNCETVTILRTECTNSQGVAISFLAALLRVSIEGGTFKKVPTGRDPQTSLEAEENSNETALDSGIFNIFGELYEVPPQLGQYSYSDPIPLNAYKGVFGTLLLAMLAQPYQSSNVEPLQESDVVSGVKEYAILLNAFLRALSSTSNLPMDTRNFVYWLCGVMPAHKTVVHFRRVPYLPNADVPEHIMFLKTLTRAYSPTGNSNTILWIMVLALIEAWKHPDSQVASAYRPLLDGISSDLPFYGDLLGVHLINNPELISALKIEDGRTVVLRLTDAYALEVSEWIKSVHGSATEYLFASTDGAMWELVPRQTKNAKYYMIYIGKLEAFIGSEPGGRPVSRDLLDRNVKGQARLPMGKHGHHRAMIIRMEDGGQDRVFPDRWCRLYGSDMPGLNPNVLWFADRKATKKIHSTSSFPFDIS